MCAAPWEKNNEKKRRTRGKTKQVSDTKRNTGPGGWAPSCRVVLVEAITFQLNWFLVRLSVHTDWALSILTVLGPGLQCRMNRIYFGLATFENISHQYCARFHTTISSIISASGCRRSATGVPLMSDQGPSNAPQELFHLVPLSGDSSHPKSTFPLPLPKVCKSQLFGWSGYLRETQRREPTHVDSGKRRVRSGVTSRE